MNQGCCVAPHSFLFPCFPMISALASYLCQFSSHCTLLHAAWYVSWFLASLPSDVGDFLLTVITCPSGQEPAVFLVLINFLSMCPIPLRPFALLAWKRPDRGHRVSFDQGGSAKPRRVRVPGRDSAISCLV